MRPLLSTFLYRLWAHLSLMPCANKGIASLGGEIRGAPEDRPQMMREAPMSSLNAIHAPLCYISAAQSRHNLRPQKQTQAILIKQIFHSSFNPRYWKDLQSLRVTLSPGMLLCLSNTDAAPFLTQQLLWQHQPPCPSVCFLESSLDSFQRRLRWANQGES